MEQLCNPIEKFKQKLIASQNLPVREKQVANSSQCPFSYRDCEDCNNPIMREGQEKIKYLTGNCRENQLRLKLIANSGLIGKDLKETFKAAKIDQYNNNLYRYLQREWDKKTWLYLYSKENGTGKSYTANAIANMLIDSKIQPLVKREVDMASELQATFSDDTGETEYALMGRWKHVPVLIIQDLGKYGCKSEWWPQHIFDIIDYRTIQNKIIIFTSNYNPEDKNEIIERFGNNHGPAIYSRLGICEIWEINGQDRRLEKAV